MKNSYDYIVIGSGFGGSVSSLRLSEKGYKVLTIEQGQRFNNDDYAKTNWQLKKYLWWPFMKMHGILKLSFYPEASILSGVGVGGGSLVYANTLFYPKKDFFIKGPWAIQGDWEAELKPFYQEAGFMMGRVKLDRFNYEDEALRKVAAKMSGENSFESVYVAVNLRKDDKIADPYFSGLGPERKSCTDCAACMVGCRENAKNTLDKNYLWFAEKFGAEILSGTKVEKIEYDGKEYIIHTKNLKHRKTQRIFHTKSLIVSGGSLGSLDLLLKQKYKHKTLRLLSDTLGENLLTNSETLCAVSGAKQKLNNGVAISSVFHPDENTHVEIVKFPDKSNSLKWFFTLATGGARNSFLRTLKLIGNTILHPLQFLKTIFNFKWSTKLVIFLVMQSLENSMKMRWKKGLFGGRMKIQNNGNKKVPAFIQVGQDVMMKYAEEVGGIPQNIILEVMLNRPTTAHILGGCLMGDSPENSVVNKNLEVHNYPGMYIIDGSVIQTNPGVNPSYSILAMAEYAMSKIPDGKNKKKTLKQLINEASSQNINN
ncbi:MAG: GMC family oxidoreductase [Bacteroidales bacterium]|nr:GMC family oxidoreductase [Bacteroidales bacterium]MCF8389643.1 GMC family oxidoreductase [Bacteroidales bacterium]